MYELPQKTSNKYNYDQMRFKLKGRSTLFIIIFALVIFFIYRFFSTGSNSDKVISSQSKINVNELFQFGSCLLKEAGKKVVEIRHGDDLKTQNKVDKSVVTQADLISHQIIVHTLNAKFTNLNIVSEENSNNKNEVDVEYYMKQCDTYTETSNDFFYSSNALTVWIDPLDATQVCLKKFKVLNSNFFSKLGIH